jgi:hypothetical protein
MGYVPFVTDIRAAPLFGVADKQYLSIALPQLHHRNPSKAAAIEGADDGPDSIRQACLAENVGIAAISTLSLHCRRTGS